MLFELQEGNTALLGPNNSGKSSLLKLFLFLRAFARHSKLDSSKLRDFVREPEHAAAQITSTSQQLPSVRNLIYQSSSKQQNPLELDVVISGSKLVIRFLISPEKEEVVTSFLNKEDSRS